MMRQIIRKVAEFICPAVNRLILPLQPNSPPLRIEFCVDRRLRQPEPPSAGLSLSAMIAVNTLRNWFNSAAAIMSLIVLSFGTAKAEPAALFASDASQPHGIRFAEYIAEASQRFDIPKAWIRAVISAESAGNAGAVSSASAMGLMQIMPRTWSSLRANLGLGSNPFDPQDNIVAGTAYLREMYDRFGMAGFLAAYNAGPVRYQQHVVTGQPLPIETQRYISMLMPMIEAARAAGPNIATSLRVSWTQAPLFAAMSDRTSSAKTSTADTRNAPAPFAQSGAGLAPLTPRSNHLFVPISGRKQP
jgi:soluble lytic murein transglycosylase-like protein